MNTELEKIAYVYGDICVRRKKQRRKRQKLLVSSLLVDYAKHSTLHGLRYIVDTTLNIFERLFWFLTVVGSLGICCFYIYNVVQKWITSPVIVTVNGRLSSVGSVPFPAVTICPQVRVNHLKYNYTEMLENYEKQGYPDSEEYYQLFHVNSQCDADLYYSGEKKLTNSSLITDIIMAATDHDDIFFRCRWQGLYKNCKMFSKVITADGVCYTANGLAATEIFKDSIQQEFNYTDNETPRYGWSLEDGYNYSLHDFYPKRGRVSSSKPDLVIELKHDPEHRDDECNSLYSGYKIYLHHPADMPQSSQYYYAAIPNQQSSVAISFHEFNSDSGLEQYDPKIRQCYFPKDRQLRYFKIYTAKNCLAECLSNYTYARCGCVGFEMPIDNSSEICFPNIYTKSCMIKAQDFMAIQERMMELGLKETGCQCLPECNTVEYDAEILKTEYRLDQIYKKYASLFGENANKKFSAVELYFKKSQFVSMQRRELFGFTDLLANIGGLLGVFLGFSFLSLIEIFYFLTVSIQQEFNYTDNETPRYGWSLEDGYNYSLHDFYPKRGRVSSSKPDLVIELKHDPEHRDDECNSLYSGYKIYLHHPADMPQSSQYYYAAIPNQQSSVAISFHEFNSDSGLEQYDPKIIISANLPDFMAIQERMMELGLKETGCQCLPECNTVEYDAEILKTEYRLDQIYKKYASLFGENANKKFSAVELYFKKSQFVSMQRRELFGFTDLLANIGGLLGVFLGFSFLSLIEIFYFLTVRVGFILKRDLEEEKHNEKFNTKTEKTT